ncbi:MAG: hypothetical protein R2736_17345 [Solirubrobacterales bacterium]
MTFPVHSPVGQGSKIIVAVLVEVVNALYLRAGRVKPAGPRRGQLARLEDSLALVLCISRDNAQRYDRACARLLVRLQQAVAVPFDQRERIHSALKALPRDRTSARRRSTTSSRSSPPAGSPRAHRSSAPTATASRPRRRMLDRRLRIKGEVPCPRCGQALEFQAYVDGRVDGLCRPCARTLMLTPPGPPPMRLGGRPNRRQ